MVLFLYAPHSPHLIFAASHILAPLRSVNVHLTERPLESYALGSNIQFFYCQHPRLVSESQQTFYNLLVAKLPVSANLNLKFRQFGFKEGLRFSSLALIASMLDIFLQNAERRAEVDSELAGIRVVVSQVYKSVWEDFLVWDTNNSQKTLQNLSRPVRTQVYFKQTLAISTRRSNHRCRIFR